MSARRAPGPETSPILFEFLKGGRTGVSGGGVWRVALETTLAHASLLPDSPASSLLARRQFNFFFWSTSVPTRILVYADA